MYICMICLPWLFYIIFAINYLLNFLIIRAWLRPITPIPLSFLLLQTYPCLLFVNLHIEASYVILQNVCKKSVCGWQLLKKRSLWIRFMLRISPEAILRFIEMICLRHFWIKPTLMYLVLFVTRLFLRCQSINVLNPVCNKINFFGSKCAKA